MKDNLLVVLGCFSPVALSSGCLSFRQTHEFGIYCINRRQASVAAEIFGSGKLLRKKNELDPVGATNILRGLAAKIKFIFISIAYWNGKCNSKPTNSEFIALIADKLQLQLKGASAANY